MQPPFGSLAGAVELAGPPVHPHERPGRPGGRHVAKSLASNSICISRTVD